eukprot:128524-Amorphochlora_amoeboformis.AAC.1
MSDLLVTQLLYCSITVLIRGLGWGQRIRFGEDQERLRLVLEVWEEDFVSGLGPGSGLVLSLQKLRLPVDV